MITLKQLKGVARVDRPGPRCYNGVMKKALCFLCAALAFISVSCDDDPMEEETNPFVGTWQHTDRDDVCLFFTTTNITNYYNHESIFWTGTYTYNDTHITVKLDQTVSAPIIVETYGDILSLEYTLEDNLLMTYEPGITTYRKVTDNS